jgi:hypothetical protein
MISTPGKVLALNIIFLIFTSFQGSSPLFSQQLNDKIKKYNTQSYNEELYVRTDRDIYVTGEHVWLKVYKLNGLAHIPWDISKVAYIELLDKNNSVVKQIKVKIEGNSGSSDFTLPDNIGSGSYTIRAYTLWMQNFSTDLFFYKTIAVINPFESIEHLTLLSKHRSADSVIISPEGGSLIGGRTTRVAVRSYDKEGSPAEMKGVILRNNRDTICKVSTKEDGFGIFELNSKDNGSYSLLFKNGNGKIGEIQLPEIRKPEVGLRVEYRQDDKTFFVKILKGGQLPSDSKNLNFAVCSAGTFTMLREINTDMDSTLTISSGELPAGLSQFLLIDYKGSQIAGRYVYKEPENSINLKITLEKSSYSPREKAIIHIAASDNAGHPVEADISASVAKSVVASSAGSQGYILPGLIGYYLNEMSHRSATEINNYLISYPAAGFNTGNLMNPDNMTFRYLPELEGHQVRGHMRLKASDEPLRDTDISLSYVGKTARCQFGKTDENGEFNFLIKETGFSEIVIQPLSSEVTGYYTEINQPFCDALSKINPPLFTLDSNSINAINNAIISMQINNIYEPYRENNPSPQITVSPDFYGTPENTIKMADYIELTTLREVVKEILPNVYTVKQSGKYDFKLINKFRGQPFTNTPLILVDGVPIYDFEKVLSINSREIEKADILNTRYFFSKNIFDGIVSFVSKKGDLSVLEFDNSIFRQVYEGCRTEESFYSPDYSSSSMKNTRIPDFRNTLFWKPDLQTDKDGNAEFEFYTSDESAGYVITVEGIAADGKNGVATAPFVIVSK